MFHQPIKHLLDLWVEIGYDVLGNLKKIVQASFQSFGMQHP
jgi:hypothetical protein